MSDEALITEVAATTKRHPVTDLVRKTTFFGAASVVFGVVLAVALDAPAAGVGAGLVGSLLIASAWKTRRELRDVMLLNRGVDARERRLPEQARAFLDAISDRTTGRIWRSAEVERTRLALARRCR